MFNIEPIIEEQLGTVKEILHKQYKNTVYVG